MSSGSPLAYRVPIVQRECNFISALVGKRLWRFSSADKEAYLNTLDRDDPDRLLQTPPTRTASIHNWIADIPTPHTPLQVQPSRLRDLTPSPLSSSLFAYSLGSPKDLDPQAHGLPVMSPSPESSPVWLATPSSQASSDCWPFPPRRSFAGRTSPASSSGPSLSAASPSTQSSPVVHSSPAPAASPMSIASGPSPTTLRSLSVVSPSSSPAPDNKLPAALSNLQALLNAGSPQLVSRSSPPVIHSSPTLHATPLRQATPVASPIIHHSPVVTRSLVPPRPRCRKRKLAVDASPAPVRSRPAVTRFEAPAVSHFSPALPDSLPSLPRPGSSMPGSFPTTIRFEPPTQVTPSASSSGFPWKTVTGIAVGAFALGCLATRYLF
ncbi:hypothetical protein VP1G_05160 [Cytospora mali]|uniref:Uncharacterized protein n=1 Tax=Cytospora mali TaxID=578113 RepID=A0A194V1Q0_CYTMA|nr:hypothetical protein VP1G_05160 [Valsa mali var. pyri (nom. inval.)]